MVHGGCFTPGGEGVIPFRHGPPHAARARKIGGGPGVIDAALVGGGDSALNVQHRAANIEMGARQRLNGGIGVGLIFAAYMTSVARQPESRKALQPMLFMGFAVVEALAILGLVLAFII